MSSQHSLDDSVLTQYLLGALPEQDAERVDEMSVANDEIAWRLRAVENDLVDAYVRGELSGETLEKFKSSYLANAERRKKVMIANALRSLEQPVQQRSRYALAWAAAVLVGAIALAYLVFVNRPPAETTRGTPSSRPTAQVRQVAPPVTLLLHPPTRSLGGIESLQLPADTEHVIVRLQLESDDFPAYQAALRDLVTNNVVWQSDRLTSSDRIVSVDVPASRFKEQNYALELSGLPPGGAAEVIASYPFHVTRK